MQRRLLTFAAILLLGILEVAPAARGALVVTMTGTIGTGTLNGASIDGEAFTMVAEIASGIDSEPDPLVGIFALNSASIQFESNRQFEFVPSELHFAQRVEQPSGTNPGNFVVGFLTTPTLAMSNSQFGYQRNSNPPMGFDPNMWQSFSDNSFDTSFARGPGIPATFSSGLNELRLTSDLGLAGASISAVPEPSGFASLCGLAWCYVSLRRRR